MVSFSSLLHAQADEEDAWDMEEEVELEGNDVVEVDDAGDDHAASDAPNPTPVKLQNWTVKDAGKVTPPTTDNYIDWKVDQLRKECTARKLDLPRTTGKIDRIKALKASDGVRRRVAERVDPVDGQLPLSLRKTDSCCPRLLNIIFSGKFAVRFALTGENITRQQLDTRDLGANSMLWKDITCEYHENTSDYNTVLVDCPEFAHLNTSVIVKHTTVRLIQMWKKVNRDYIKALAMFTASGTHEKDFYGFTDSLDTFYLRWCLNVKPELTCFVEGGLHDEDTIDSLDSESFEGTGRKRKAPASSSAATKQEPWQMALVKEIRSLSAIVQREESPPPVMASAHASVQDPFDVAITRIAKLHDLIDQVEARLQKLADSGASDAGLERSLGIYQRQLDHYELQLTVG